MSKHKNTISGSLKPATIVRILLSLIVPIIIISISFYRGGFAPFGNKDILNAGKSTESVFYYFEMYDHFKDSNASTYSNCIGMVHDYISDYLYHLSDPTNLIILLFPRTSVTAVINILYMLKLALCSCFFSIFLTGRKKTQSEESKTDFSSDTGKSTKANFILGGSYEPKTSFGHFLLELDPINIALSLSFALSQYFLSEGTNINYLLAIAVLPLIIMGLDNLLDNGSMKKLIIFMTVSFYMNVYITIISFILITIYFFILIPVKREIFFNRLKKFFLSVTASLLLSAAVLIPVLTNSDFRNDISLSFVRLRLMGNPLNVLSQFMFKTNVAYLSIYDNGINLYFGLLGIILLLSFFVNSGISINTRIKHFFFVLFLLSGTVISTSNYLLNGFRGYTDNVINYGYFLIFIILVLAYEATQNIRSISKPGFTIVSSLFAGLVLCAMKFAENLDSIKPLYYSLEILLAYYLIILIFSDRSMTRVLFAILTSLICIGEISFTYSQNLTNLGQTAYVRPTTDSDYYKIYQTAAYVHKNIDKDAAVLSLDTDTYDTNPFITSMLGFEYLVTSELNSNIEDIYTYERSVVEDGNVLGKAIYKNDKNINSTLMNTNITTYSYNPDYPFTSTNILCTDYINCKNIFKIIDGNTETSEVYNKNAVNFSFSAYDKGDIYARAYHTVHIGSNSESEPVESYQVSPLDRYNEYTYQYAEFIKDNYFEDIKLLSTSTENSKLVPEKEYSIDTSDKCYLYVPVRKCANLVVNVNGKNVDPKSFIYDSILIPLEKGSNKVEFYYSYNLLIYGILISIFSLILLVLCFKHIVKTESNNTLKKAECAIISFICNNITYIVTVFIMTAVFIVCQMITGSYPFGTKSTIMDDGISQGYPVFLERLKLIKNGTAFPFISQNIGINRELYSTIFLTHLTHPWQVLIMRILPESLYLLYFTFIYYLIYVSNSISVIYYMTHRHFNRINKHNPILILIGIVYGLSSYSIVMFNYQCFRILLYLPLIILGLEKIIYEKKSMLYIISLAILMIFDHYYAFIICEMLIITFFTYKYDDIKHFIQSGIRFAVASIAAAGLSTFKMLTYFANTSSSGYAIADKKTPSITVFFKPFIEMLSAYHPLSYLKAISDDNSKAAIYVGILILLLLPLYAINNKLSLSTRIKNIVFLVVIYIAFNNELLNYAFHGFHYQSLAPNRFAAFFVFLLTCIITDTLLNFEEYSPKHLIPSALFASVIYTVIHIANKDFRDWGIIIGLILLLSCLVYITTYSIRYHKNSINKKAARSFIMAIMMFDCIINGVFLLSNNIGSDSAIIKDAESINNATSVYNELTEPFTGTAFLDHVNNDYNIACMTDIQSPSFFYSGATTSTLNMYTKYNLQHELNVAYYSTGNPLADMMMHTKYHLSDKYINSGLSWYPIKANVNNIEIRENPYFLPLGFMIGNYYASNLDEWDQLSKTYTNLFEYQNDFAAAFDDRKLYDIIDIKESTETLEDKSYYTIDTIIDNSNMQNSDYEVPVNIHLDSKDMTPGYYYVSVLGKYNFLMYFTSVNEKDINLTISIPSDTMPDINTIKASFCIARLNQDTMEYMHDILDKNVMTDIKTNGKAITASINTKISGKLYISLPYDSNWEIKVDNKAVTAKPYLGGIGIDMTSGNHTIMIKYHPTGMYEGLLITISTIIIILLILYKNKRATNSKHKKTE